MDYSRVRLFAFESPCKVCEPGRRRAQLGSFEVLKDASWNGEAAPGTINDVTKTPSNVPSD